MPLTSNENRKDFFLATFGCHLKITTRSFSDAISKSSFLEREIINYEPNSSVADLSFITHHIPLLYKRPRPCMIHTLLLELWFSKKLKYVILYTHVVICIAFWVFQFTLWSLWYNKILANMYNNDMVLNFMLETHSNSLNVYFLKCLYTVLWSYTRFLVGILCVAIINLFQV